jgi:Na+-driven multidrug efflux pump
MVVLGFLLLYFLRGLLARLIVLILGVIGIVIALVLIAVGLGLIFGGRWARGRWRRYVTVET